MAEIDFFNGKYEIKDFGKQVAWHGIYKSLLFSNYNVKLNTVAGCIVSSALIEYVNGYNYISRHHLIDLYGKDILIETSEIAEKDYQLTKQ